MPGKTITIATLGGVEVTGISELGEISVEAIWDGGDIQASITERTFRFKGEANERLIELWEARPTEGAELKITITDGTITYEENFFTKFEENFRRLSKVESEVQIAQDNGALTYQNSAAGLTILLLKDKGLWTSVDAVNIPYVVENRKRLLEFLTMSITLFQLQKSIFDEIYKLIGISSDIASGAWITTIPAAVIAVINLIRTIFNLILLTIQMIKLLLDMQKLLFAPIRYHKGMNLFDWLQRGTEYLGYAFETGEPFGERLREVNLCPSKNDEVGPTAIAVEFTDSVTPEVDQGDGLLKPNDFGYTLGEAIELTKLMFDTKVGVLDGVVHIRPQNDEFWNTEAVFDMPDVLIEQALAYENGWFEYNYNEQITRYLVRYAKDDTDYHTLTDTNNRVSELIYSPIEVTEQKRVNLKGAVIKDIPYALCVPKPAADNLFTNFVDLEKLFNTLQETINNIWDEFPLLSSGGDGGDGQGPPNIEKFLSLLFIRKNALVVENHFFAVPKIVILNEKGRIPEDYKDRFSADALFNEYHSFNTMAPGFKDPDNPDATAQKIVFRQVKIPFGLKGWDEVKENSRINTVGFGEGQLRNLKWVKDKDFATADFHIFQNWNNNLQAKLFKLGPISITE